MYRQSPIFFILHYEPFWSHTTNMATFVVLRHPVTILVIVLNTPDNLTNDIIILNL